MSEDLKAENERFRARIERLREALQFTYDTIDIVCGEMEKSSFSMLRELAAATRLRLVNYADVFAEESIDARATRLLSVKKLAEERPWQKP